MDPIHSTDCLFPFSLVLYCFLSSSLFTFVGNCKNHQSVMNLVATHYISCTTLQLHITYGLHLPSFSALTHSHPLLHQSHSCHQSLINPDCLTTPAPHSHTHTRISSTLPCKHCEVLFLPRLTFLSVIHPAICYLCV